MREVFVDIDTQKDFMNKDGKLYVPGAEKIKPNLKKLTKFANKKQIPILATKDIHKKNDKEFEQFRPHCIINTDGSKKISETKSHFTKTFKKHTFDVFDRKLGNIAFECMLESFDPDEVVVYGVATDVCVVKAVLGIIDLRFNVIVVKDAITGVNERDTQDAIEKMKNKGVSFKTTKEIIKC